MISIPKDAKCSCNGTDICEHPDGCPEKPDRLLVDDMFICLQCSANQSAEQSYADYLLSKDETE